MILEINVSHEVKPARAAAKPKMGERGETKKNVYFLYLKYFGCADRMKICGKFFFELVEYSCRIPENAQNSARQIFLN